eukprot:6608964-Pyramimonas_sp.AAC.1
MSVWPTVQGRRVWHACLGNCAPVSLAQYVSAVLGHCGALSASQWGRPPLACVDSVAGRSTWILIDTSVD